MNLKHISSAVSETPPPPIIPDGLDDGQITSPAEIDARRAHGLLDRAQHLAERGDLPAALLACRQAIALDHDSPEGYSMLGTLLERTGDLTSAQNAYNKALELAPNRVLDVESLKRLHVKMAAAVSAAQVKFSESDLLATDSLPTRVETPIAPAPAPHIPTAEEVEQETATLGEIPTLDIDARLPPSRAAATEETLAPAVAETAPASVPAWAAPPTPAPPAPDPYIAQAPKNVSIFGPATSPAGTDQRIVDRRQLDLPIETERRTGDDRRFSRPLTTPFVFDPMVGTRPVPLWAQLVRGPSFFGRTLPLVVVTVFSLGFLGWARSRAVAQYQPTSTVVASTQLGDNLPTDPAPQVETVTTQTVNPAPNPIVAVPTVAPGGAVSISNVPQNTTVTNNPGTGAQGSGAQPATSTTPNRGNTTRPRGSRPSTSRPVPNFPGTLPPAAIAPGAIRRGNDGNSGRGASNLGLPAPQINNQQPASPPITVLPANDSLPPVGGPPLNPAGSSRRGYIKIQQGRLGSSGDSSLPQRPASQANSDEQQATNAARNGQTDQAINRLSNAINSGNSDPNDMGFRLQQRASLFLDRNDYVRAADDFQAAITAYQDQIDRGQNVASARAGLKASRSGLNLALAGQRGG